MAVHRLLVSLTTACLLAPSIVYAQPADPAFGPPSATPPTVATGEAASSDIGEAASDHAFISPGGITQRAGTWSFSSYELAVGAATYSPSDDLQITGAFAYGGVMVAGGLSGKLRLFSRHRTQLAIQAGVLGSTVSNSVFYQGGVAATHCIDAGCYSRVNAYLGYLASDDADLRSSVLGSVSGVFAMDSWLQGVVELGFGAKTYETSNPQPRLFMVGLRVNTAKASFDFGLLRQFDEGTAAFDVSAGGSVFPYLGMTYRGI